MAQAVEHVLGKDEVTSSNLVNSSRKLHGILWSFFVMCMEKRLRGIPAAASHYLSAG